MGRKRSALGICTAIWIALSAAFAMTGCGADAGEKTEEPFRKESGASQEREDSQESAASREQEGSQESSAMEDVSAEAGQNSTDTLNLTFRLAGGPSGLPEEIQEQIVQINQGIPPSDVLGETVPEGYYALVATYTVTAQDKESGEESTGSGKLTLYIPNLVEGLEDVSVLCYDNAAGEWKLLPVESMDTEKKTLSVILTGSGTLTVIYRRHDQGKAEF